MSACWNLIFLTTLALVCNVHSQVTTFTDLKDTIELSTDELIPHASVCALAKFPELYFAGTACAETMVRDITNYIETNNLGGLSYAEVYNRIIKAPVGGQSVVCGWFKTYSPCFDLQVSCHCGQRVQNAVKRIFSEIEKYACSINPPFLECIMEPTFIENNQQSKICIDNFVNIFTPYFSNNRNEFLTNWQNMYNALILPQNGLLFSSVKSLGSCLGNVISALSRGDCGAVGNLVRSHFATVTDYVDHGKPGSRDYVKCFANPQLWGQFSTCTEQLVQGFMQDPVFTSPNDDIGSNVLLQLRSGNTQAFRSHYRQFSACAKGRVQFVCGVNSQSYLAMVRVLTPLDQYFQNQYTLQPSTCAAGVITAPPGVTETVPDVLIIASGPPMTPIPGLTPGTLPPNTASAARTVISTMSLLLCSLLVGLVVLV